MQKQIQWIARGGTDDVNIEKFFDQKSLFLSNFPISVENLYFSNDQTTYKPGIFAFEIFIFLKKKNSDSARPWTTVNDTSHASSRQVLSVGLSYESCIKSLVFKYMFYLNMLALNAQVTPRCEAFGKLIQSRGFQSLSDDCCYPFQRKSYRRNGFRRMAHVRTCLTAQRRSFEKRTRLIYEGLNRFIYYSSRDEAKMERSNSFILICLFTVMPI